MRFDPHRLLILRAVAEAGEVMAAGHRLHLAPFGISQRLAALERETGLVLLDRSRSGGQRPAQLTTAGWQLAGHADRLAQVLAEAEADLLSIHDPNRGPVRLAAFPTAIRGLVVPALHAQFRSLPGIEPTVVERDQQYAVPALHTGDLDLALTEDDAHRPPSLGTRGCGCSTTPTGW